MTDQELTSSDARSGAWMENPSARLDDARSFIESVGFCLMYPMRPPVLAPIFLAAWVGSEENLPTRQHVYADPRAHDATDLMVLPAARPLRLRSQPARGGQRLPRRRVCFPLLLCAGRRTQSQAGPQAWITVGVLATGVRCLTQPSSGAGRSQSTSCLKPWAAESPRQRSTRPWRSCWPKLRVTRVDYNATEGAFWDVLYRWAPDAVKEGVGLSVVEALSASVSKYLDCVVAAELHEIEEFFGRFVARSKVKDAVNGLLSARELSYVTVGRRPLLQMTPAKLPKGRPPNTRRKAAGAVR